MFKMSCRLQWLVTYLTLVRQWTSCYCLWCMPTTASSMYIWMPFITHSTFSSSAIQQGYFITLKFANSFCQVQVELLCSEPEPPAWFLWVKLGFLCRIWYVHCCHHMAQNMCFIFLLQLGKCNCVKGTFCFLGSYWCQSRFAAVCMGSWLLGKNLMLQYFRFDIHFFGGQGIFSKLEWICTSLIGSLLFPRHIFLVQFKELASYSTWDVQWTPIVTERCFLILAYVLFLTKLAYYCHVVHYTYSLRAHMLLADISTILIWSLVPYCFRR